MTRPARIAVVYYSATGNVHPLAHALAEGAGGEGAKVRLRHVEELASELVISQNQYWGRHRSEVEDKQVASLERMKWSDAVAFGTPTRFGNVAAQLKQFMDQAGRLWQEGKFRDPHQTASSGRRDRRTRRSAGLRRAVANPRFRREVPSQKGRCRTSPAGSPPGRATRRG